MNRTELIRFLSAAPDSPEVLAMRREADALSRQRFGNRGLLLGQIGVERHLCPGQCRFCVFSEKTATSDAFAIDPQRTVQRAGEFIADGLDALFLMTMHDFDAERLLELIGQVRRILPPETQLVLNIGDCPPALWGEFRAAGATGAYHVLRLREGTDTALRPADRLRTITAIRDAGLDWYYCCEPVGPEHTAGELADAILLGNEFGCYQHAAMARVNYPGSPLAGRGEISRTRLAQIVAAVAFASTDNARLKTIAVHEPDPQSLRSGANSVYAECGANPRDNAADTAAGRGHGAAELKNMLREAGWK